MTRYIRLSIALCCLSFAFLQIAYGQIVSQDTSSKSTSLNNIQTYYARSVSQQLPLYNGPEYYFYDAAEIRGSAYFQDMMYIPGNVYYDGAEYKNVQLLYDLYKDELTTILFDQYSKYKLVKKKVQSFDLLTYHFINISADTLDADANIKAGYYQELYRGGVQVLSKRSKATQNYASTTGLAEAYTYFDATKEDFFIRKNKNYYKVNSEGALIDALKDRKKELQQYIKTNKIKFKKDPPQALVSIAAYYDHITN